MSDDKSSKEYLAECEARYWLEKTKAKPDAVKALIASIKKLRGSAAAELLRNNMRMEYRKITKYRKR